jgi:hypothetical protein
MKKHLLCTRNLRLTVTALALAAFIIAFVWLVFVPKHNTLQLSTDNRIGITPEQIQSIKAIGEWEFLSIADEEMVDTMRKGLFSDDHLVRIYYGTLRLGINLNQARPDWLETHGDTIVATLPKIALIDNDFIDEARTKPFYESGRWTAADREAMYRQAHRKMKLHSLTPANIKSAENNAELQFRRMFSAMGYNTVIIKWE